MKLNPNTEERDLILFGEPAEYGPGKTVYFRIVLSELQELLNSGFIDPDDSLNGSPTPDNYLEFLLEHPDFSWTVHGKAHPDGITIEGIQKDGKPSWEETRDFANAFHCADEFEVSEEGLFCRFD